MTKTKKPAPATSCPVEPYARRVAHLLRVRLDTRNGKLSDHTNLGEGYARQMIFQQIAALGVLASYETATSEIGRAYQLMVTRAAMFDWDFVDKLRNCSPTEQELIRASVKDVERGLDAATWSIVEKMDDPDIIILRAEFGPTLDEEEPHQNKPFYAVLNDYVDAKPATAA